MLCGVLACWTVASHAGDPESSDEKSELTKKLEEKVPGGRDRTKGQYLDEAPPTDERSEPTTIVDPVTDTFKKNWGNVKHDPNCDQPGVKC
jgi:hypothetical protein